MSPFHSGPDFKGVDGVSGRKRWSREAREGGRGRVPCRPLWEAGPRSARLQGHSSRRWGSGIGSSHFLGVSTPLCVFAYAAAVESRKAEQSDLKREKACTNRSANVTAHSQQRKGGRAAWMPPTALAPCCLAWLPAHQPMDPLPGRWVTFLQRQGSPDDFCRHPRHSATVVRGFGSELEALPNIWAEISEEIKHMFIIS